MMIAGVGLRSVRAARDSKLRSAWLHLGRATPEATAAFLEAQSSPRAPVLRLKDQAVSVGALGVGSPSLWAKDVPRIDGSKHVISSRQGNFLQASINPYVEPLGKTDEKQSYVESLILQELIEGEELPMAIGGSALPLPSPLADLKSAENLLIVADRVFTTSLSNGKPFAMRSYAAHLGEDIALLLKSAFNLAISIERKYMESILPSHSHLKLPTAEDVAWAHILANQHAQFDNVEEWNYIRETQIQPRFELTVRQFEPYEELKEFGFAYNMALRELLKCFTASVELVDASRAENMITALKDAKLMTDDEQSLEQLAVKAALSGGADIVLVEEQLGKRSSIKDLGSLMTDSQLEELHHVARSHLSVE
ncbi:hypothetical protein ATCC90586_005734 [Pythium insidiosum]|nr:hypothetical protein ATCC90586_005734 [Pythium insidiosum]